MTVPQEVKLARHAGDLDDDGHETAGGLTVKDEGTPLATTASSIDFVGAGVTASGATGAKTVTIPASGVAEDLTTAETDPTLVLAADGTGGVEFRAESGSGLAEDLATAETNTALVLAPDGGGGVEFRAETGGSGGSSSALVELLSTNDSEFTSTVGNWVAGGSGSPTVARETTVKMTGQSASLKVHSTASGGYAEVPIAGTFESGQTYWAVMTIWKEPSPTLTLGLIGTDDSSYATAVNRNGATSPVSWRTYAVRWKPTADRTGVKLRVAVGIGGTIDFYVGIVKVYDSPILPIIPTNGSTRALLLPNFGGNKRLSMDPDAGGIVYDTSNGSIKIYSISERGTVQVGAFGDDGVLLSQQHTPGDLVDAGINLEVGDDFLGLWISEKDSSTIQIYDAANGSYDIELVDQDTTVGFWSVSVAGVRKRLVDMEHRSGSGTATITSGNTSITVTHGAGYTPAAQDIMVCPTNSPTNDPGNFWVSTITSTQFNINVRANPGASGASFAWRVDR